MANGFPKWPSSEAKAGIIMKVSMKPHLVLTLSSVRFDSMGASMKSYSSENSTALSRR
jgi:hypothetical protein